MAWNNIARSFTPRIIDFRTMFSICECIWASTKFPQPAKLCQDPINHLIEGSLEVKLPTIWTDEKQSRAEAERRGRLEERRSEEKE